uniref:NADH-ubiquinone oxidoreductase chain 6 n=1 Tax=Helochares sp. BMNH1425100 TaxID=2558027 RepID=A0A191ZRE4_9COLE|nr:NADH dehydrogenase subunit 6 [Helochares sp. BMNH1425100]
MLCMTMIMFNVSLMLSVFIVFTSHPLSMGMTLLLQVICVSLITGLMTYNFWFSYILFLIMIGGMLVLFIYMTSIASNEKFNYSSMLMKLFLMLTIIMLPTLFLDQTITESWTANMETLNNMKMNLMLSKFMNYPYNMLLFSLIIYLFIALIAVVKISKIKYGPLRQMN